MHFGASMMISLELIPRNRIILKVYEYFLFVLFFGLFLRATTKAYEGSQARGPIGAVA